MSGVLCFVGGALFGALLTSFLLCALRLHRVNECEAEIRKLRTQINMEH